VLDDLKAPALVLAGAGIDLGPVPDGVTLVRLGDPVPADGGWRSVLLAVADEAALRRAASVLPFLGRARRISCYLAAAATPPTPLLRPEWPDLVDLDAVTREDGSALTRLVFRPGAPAGPVLVELARRTGDPVTTGNHGLVLALAGGTSPPPVDPSVVLADPGDPEREVPPAVVVGASTALPEHPVTGRAPVVVAETDVLGAGPLDEALLNPRGFRTDWHRAPVPLPDGEPTPGMVASLRDAQAVVVGPGAPARTVAGLAMAGVPLVGEGFDAVDLDDPLRREEHSVRLRRDALRRHSALAWRHRLAAGTDERAAAYPSVSVLLAVDDPERLEHAVRQVARQRGVERLEVVLAARGFTPAPGQVAALLGGLAHQVLVLPAATGPGEVLRRASEAAAGDLVATLRGEDWYGPDVVADLLLALRYSGVELVTMPAELSYVERLRTTVRRRERTEVSGAVPGEAAAVAIDRSVLRAVGGLRPVPDPDARLVEDLRAAGGSVYRTHGLGHVRRRTSPGSGWRGRLELRRGRGDVAGRWRGFRPSALLEHPGDAP
jgi:hypothetical protein